MSIHLDSMDVDVDVDVKSETISVSVSRLSRRFSLDFCIGNSVRYEMRR